MSMLGFGNWSSGWWLGCRLRIGLAACLLLLPGLASAVNVLTNGSFESPTVSGCGNHVNTAPTGGWNKINPTGQPTTGSWNIVLPTANPLLCIPPYQNPVAQDGNQYLDIDGAGNYVYQSFSLSQSSIIQFGAWFSNRETGGGSGDYSSTIGIYNNTTNGTLRSPLVTVNLSAGDKPSTTWTQGSGSVVLPSGAYRIRINLNNFNNVDNVVVDVNAGTAALQVIKQLSPADDPGEFNITVDGTTIGTDLGHNDTTGLVAVTSSGGAGFSHTIAETAGTGTNLTDYVATYSCTCTGGTCPVSPVTGSGSTVNIPVRTNNIWTCTFTNTRKQGTLTVVKALSPDGDPGQFNLTIDGVAKVSDVGNGGTTGDVSVNTGTHTVGETAGTGTNLLDYDTTYSCTNGTGSTATVVANQNTTCTITNTRKPSDCRILSLKSTGTVTPPGSALFGTGAYIATPSAGVYSIVLKTGAETPPVDFTGRGLIYNDGQFPVSPGCTGPAEECFLYQNTFSTPTASVTDLDGLILGTATGPAGDKITFGAGGTYTYTGTKFLNGHKGTYKATRDCTTVPEPGTLLLMLLPLAGLRAIRQRRLV